MRVLHTNFHLGWGGQAARVFALCKGLRDLGVEAIVAAPKGSVLLKKCDAVGLRIFGDVHFSKGLRPLHFVHDVRALKRFMLANGIDILHTHGAQDTWSGTVADALCPKTARPAVVRTRHNTFPVQFTLHNKLLYRRLIDRLIIVSDSVIQQYSKFIESGIIHPENVTTIHSSIKVERFNPDLIGREEARAAFGIQQDVPVVVVAARLAREKGHKFLIEAMSSLIMEFPGLVLLIAGEGNQEESLKAQTKALNLSDNIRFIGFHEDVPRVLATADVSVLPSIDCDASSATIKESMAMRVPIVATLIGGAAEIIDDGVDGLIVPPADAAALATAIGRLLRDPELRARMGEAGREKVIERFTEERLARDTLEVYRSMMSARSDSADG
ncbi:MAG: glycosyltransferase family 4 protein [Candidatus Coatesbacteria bacterium]|nr:glycosyltransferase family 4 protein [Candidatus Coatesbacteria bacterium]